MKQLEEKQFTAKVDDIDKKNRIVTGYFTSSETLDFDNDVFEKNAFRKSIQERGPKGKNKVWHLWMHDSFSPINKPMELEEREQGVWFKTMFPKNSISDLVFSLYETGSITEHSVGFYPVKDKYENDYRVIIEAAIKEGSAVLWGANENTPTESVKSEIDLQIKSFDDVLKNITFTEKEKYELLSNKLEEIKHLINTQPHISKSTEPERETSLILPKNFNFKLKI